MATETAFTPKPSTLPWQTVERTRIPTPPAEHPRLYLRKEHLAELPERFKAAELQIARDDMEKRARKSAQGRVEWEALRYLVSRDAAQGRKTIEATLKLLKECELPNKQDACRVTGRMMVTGALVYDWLYALLTPAEKQAMVKELIRLAKTQECGYPPRGGTITGHSCEAMIMRDMLSAGIAIYDEYPEMYHAAAARFFQGQLVARNWLYAGHAYHQGSSYGVHRFSWDSYPLWIFDRLGAGTVYNPEQRFVPYYYVYLRRPDGQRMRGGDVFSESTSWGTPWATYVENLFIGSYYNDGILLGEYLRTTKSIGDEAIFDFLWRNLKLAPKPETELPLTRYFGSPFGWMVARTGWDANAAIVEMKINEYNFVNHQHLDAGAFQIYYKGALAIDSGTYYGSSGHYGSPHNMNYSWRTIAHNSLLIYDPEEKFNPQKGYANDGGQRLPNNRSEAKDLAMFTNSASGYRTGKVLGHGFGPDPRQPSYTYLEGDITPAYSAKAREVVRSFVFLNLQDAKTPAALLVLDRVASANPAHRKYWLLHTLEEPKVNGGVAVIDRTEHQSRGRLVLSPLLPAGAELAKVGGPGKEFWVFGKNFANDLTADQKQNGSFEQGAWRLELTPKAAQAQDVFLSALQITDQANSQALPVKLVELGERVGCSFENSAAQWLVVFNRQTARSQQPITLNLQGSRSIRCLVTGLAGGTWTVTQAGQSRQIEVKPDEGTLGLEGKPGNWLITRAP